MVLEIESLIEMSASLALVSLAIFLVVMTFQLVSFFKRAKELMSETSETMKIYRALGEESTVAVQQSQEILEVGKELTGDVVEVKRTITSTGSAICSNLVDVAIQMLSK